MKSTRRWTGRLAALSGVVMVSVPALAQVATPPPAAPPSTPEYVPPPAPPTPAAAPRRGPGIDRSLPAGGPMTEKAPDIPFQPLARDENGELIRDEKGNLRPLPLPIEIMALDRNPTVGEITMHRLKPFLRERKAQMEKVAIDNLDMVQQIDAGVFERVDIKKKEELIALTEMLRPLIAPGALSMNLQKRDLLTKIQTATNQKITKQYQTDVVAEIKAKAKAAGADEAAETTKILLYNSVDEVMFAYRVLLMETGRRLAATGDKHSDAEYLEMGRKHLEPLKLEERQAELRKTIELRPPPPPDGPEPKPAGNTRIRQATPEELQELQKKVNSKQKPGAAEHSAAPENTQPAPK